MFVHTPSEHVLERVKRQLTRLRGDSATDGQSATTPPKDAGDETDPSPDQQASPRLFRCPSCEAVYIARGKETCRTCDTEVTLVQ